MRLIVTILISLLTLVAETKLLILLVAIFLQLFKFICVCCPDELSIHVKDLTLRVHQELTVISFNLYPTHDHIVFHINASCLFIFWTLDLILIVWVVIVLIWICVFEFIHLRWILLLMIIFNIHCVLFIWTTLSWMSSLPSIVSRVAFLVYLILIFIIKFKWIIILSGWIVVLELFRLFQWLILEIHWVVCLIIQESLSFKEILTTLKCTLLLHLLKTVLIWLKNFLCWALRICKDLLIEIVF